MWGVETTKFLSDTDKYNHSMCVCYLKTVNVFVSVAIFKFNRYGEQSGSKNYNEPMITKTADIKYQPEQLTDFEY